MDLYKAYSLNIASEIEFPELKKSNKAADISITLGKVCQEGLKDPKQGFAFCQVSQNELWLKIPNVAAFHMIDGKNIIVDIDPQSDLKSVRLFLLGSCIGAILQQRRQLALHSNAIRVGGGCVLFMGISGIGKSTLAAAFNKRGYQVLADDIAVVDEKNEVHPGIPQLKLWQDTLHKLEIEKKGRAHIRPEVEKYAFPLKSDFCEKPLPIKAIYLLSQHNQDEFIKESFHGINKFNPIKNNTYRLQYIKGMGLEAWHMQRCCSLAAITPITKITRPNFKFCLKELIDIIEKDLHEQKVAA